MKNLISKNLIHLLFCCCSVFILGCKSVDGLTIDINDEKLMINNADTLTITASSFLLDPLPTAANKKLLVGGTVDEQFGQVAVSSYFRLSASDLSLEKLPDEVTYDSLSIELYYNKYSYGDTSRALRLDIHRVIQDIEPKELPIALEDDEYPVFVSEATLYSDRTFDYDPISLGGITIIPRPNTKTDTLRFRLDDILGKQLLGLAENKDSKLVNNDDFVEYFKGLLLRSDGASHAAIGLQDSLKLRIHYSYDNEIDGKKASGALMLGIGPSKYQYNQITANRNNTNLADLTFDNQEIASSKTENKTFIQGSTGIVTRLRFPTLRSFLSIDNKALSKATLIIETDQSGIGNQPPPTSLILMAANKYGTPTSIVQGANGNATAVYQPNTQSGGVINGRYEFDITDYVSKLIKQSGFDEKQSLLLTLPTKDLLSSVNRLIIAKQQNKPAIKLNILYVNY